MERCGRVACFHNAGDQRDVSRGCFKMRWSLPNPFLSTWVLRAVWRGREAASVARHWGCVSLHHEAGHPHSQRRSPGEAARGVFAKGQEGLPRRTWLAGRRRGSRDWELPRAPHGSLHAPNHTAIVTAQPERGRVLSRVIRAGIPAALGLRSGTAGNGSRSSGSR